jgi:alanine dehydrogenase
LSIQAGAFALEKSHGGRGVLLGGVPGVESARVVIIGGGVVGFNAAQMAVGMQADVTILDTNPYTIERLDHFFGNTARVIHSNKHALHEFVINADMVVGGVLVVGSATPKLVTRGMLAEMRDGAVLVDVAIDQGGCFETSRPTTHADPTYIIDGIVHYCVANMPGAVPRTSTYALNNATLPGLLAIADKGWRQALRDDEHLLNGLNVCQGQVTYRAVAEELGYSYVDPSELLL